MIDMLIMPQQALTSYSGSASVRVHAHDKGGTVVTQHMEHEYLNILSNKIAARYTCYAFHINFTITTIIIIIIILQSSSHFAGKYTCHLCSSYNEALLHTFKKLTKSFSSTDSHLLYTSSFSPMPTTLSHLLSLSTLLLSSFLSLIFRHARQPTSFFPLVLSFPPSSCWANLMSVFISLTARHFSLLLQADTWPEW